MFAVVKTVYLKPKGGFKKLFKAKPECTLDKIKINRSYFYQLTIKSAKKKINLKRIFKTINVTDVPVILPEPTPSLEGINIRQYNCADFRKKVLINCLKKHCGKNSKIFVMGNQINDTDYLYDMLKFFKQVTILTSHPESYNEQNEIAEIQLGTTAVLTDNPALADDSDAVLNLSNSATDISHPLIFGCGGYTFSDYDLRLPKSISRLIPRYINPLSFTAALCELCEVNELKNTVPSKIFSENSGTTINIAP